jgi:type IV secretion system protein VirB10
MAPSTPEPPNSEPVRVQDSRVAPQGVLPRQIQTWLMVGLAFVIVLIILVTGHSDPPAKSSAGTKPPAPTLAPADRIRSYAQQLADEETRQRDVPNVDAAARGGAGRASGAGRGAGSATDDQRRREAQSLFADNVALSRRPAGQSPAAAPAPGLPTKAASNTADPTSEEVALLEQALSRMGAPHASAPEAPAVAPSPSSTAVPAARGPMTTPDTPSTEYPASGERRRLLEGTVIETALVNRLDGTFAGPVVCLVTTPVYTHDRQAVVIPAGARLLGASSPVQSWGDSRLAVSFHRLVMPDGHTYSLNLFKGLDQIGESGLRDAVNRHYLQVFGASLAIGALSGLAQYGTRSTAGVYDFGTEYRQATGASLATSASRILDRYLNVLPTITVREGARVKVYLSNDFELPVYVPASGALR